MAARVVPVEILMLALLDQVLRVERLEADEQTAQPAVGGLF